MKRKRSCRSGWRMIGGKHNYYRSRWEANYAHYLEFRKRLGQIHDWEHEPETFWFLAIKRGIRSYLPDFRITRNNETQYFVEVKGYMDAKSKTKLKRMKKYHPAVELVLVDADSYRALEKRAKSFVPNWEK